ncbi:hypothetical protein QPK32_01595 [Massilia sp. YIM B02763]|uniref:hypothetical protein n=1 Tax=Massilia sp. YIM B02763 TaxID=3050130 RepID=UPI0025B6E00D|nr:hypothetical protein [Massilia sp. YIM B02763]MDN4051778.1 hypothetical protein [Massilia sp. YIM B02763]
MHRLVVMMVLLGIGSASFAKEPAFCKSVCGSERNTCRANAQASEKSEGLLPTSVPEKNPFARTAQLQMRSDDGGALEKAGNDQRRMSRVGQCEQTYQRCTRGCSKPAEPKAG